MKKFHVGSVVEVAKILKIRRNLGKLKKFEEFQEYYGYLKKKNLSKRTDLKNTKKEKEIF